MLLSGEIDAAISARVPEAFDKGGGRIARLYPDYRLDEMRYYDATGIFPIMHVIAMRRVGVRALSVGGDEYVQGIR